jgi:hypothetical protein
MKSVYSAVRTGPLNTAACTPSFKVEVENEMIRKNRNNWVTQIHTTRYAYSNIPKKTVQ